MGRRVSATLRVEVLTGAALVAALEDLAALRIAVFRDWPYIYDGDMAYEADYLRAYTQPGAVCVGVWDGAALVGASTGAPMAQHAADFAEALPDDLPVAGTFYCAESVLLPTYRGRGLGHRFFDLREAHARALGLKASVFASVVRPSDHPARPAGYRPLDGFWRARGYAPLPGAIAQFAWKDLGEAGETLKPLQLWARKL
ncbi:MAG: GNAT family N-acetyltransferase [Pseudomonadota bacterium]